MNKFVNTFSKEETQIFYHQLNPGARIKFIRQKLSSSSNKKYSLTAIGKQTNINPSTLSRFENKNTNLQLDSFLKLTNYLNCSLDLALKGRLIYRNSKFKLIIRQELKNMTSYNERIKYIYTQLNLKTKDLKNSVVSPSTFNKIINNKVNPKIKTILQIADLFNINLDLLIHGYYPSNQLEPIKEYKNNLKNLIEEFPTQLDVLKTITHQQFNKQSLKGKFTNIIDSLIKVIDLLPHQLKLKELLIHDFQAKLNKIKSFYQPLAKTIKFLNKVIKNSAMDMPADNQFITSLTKIEEDLNELQLTLDGLHFHQQNKESNFDKDLTIFSTITKPLSHIAQSLEDLSSQLKSDSMTEIKPNQINSKVDQQNQSNTINTKKILKRNPPTPITNHTVANELRIDELEINSQYSPNLKELYIETNEQLNQIKKSIRKYKISDQIKKLPVSWQLYDLLQLELKLLLNKEFILKKEPNKKIKITLQRLMVYLINFLYPFNKLLKELNNKITYQKYYTNHLIEIIYQELLILPTDYNLLSADLLAEFKHKTEEFINTIKEAQEICTS